jgi:hypothetical protein
MNSITIRELHTLDATPWQVQEIKFETVLNNDVLLSALAVIPVLEMKAFRTGLIVQCRNNKCSVSKPRGTAAPGFIRTSYLVRTPDMSLDILVATGRLRCPCLEVA